MGAPFWPSFGQGGASSTRMDNCIKLRAAPEGRTLRNMGAPFWPAFGQGGASSTRMDNCIKLRAARTPL